MNRSDWQDLASESAAIRVDERSTIDLPFVTLLSEVTALWCNHGIDNEEHDAH